MPEAAATSKLFTPLQLGACKLQHRIAMAPLTRCRATAEHVPSTMAIDYYAQRATEKGTLIVTEATFISAAAGGMPNVPGIYTKEQAQAWKKITDAVHEKGSFIFMQLWALGRAANPGFLEKDGLPFVSSSSVPIQTGDPAPKELTEQEIQQYIKDYAEAARMAVHEAGFDGVEIHAANGYLIDQFTQDTCNKRADAWGGNAEKRAKFAIEVTKAVIAAVGVERTGIRLSPYSEFQGMKMQEPLVGFSYLVKKLNEFKLVYLHLVDARIAGNQSVKATESLEPLIELWTCRTPMLLAGGLTAETAKEMSDVTYADRNVIAVFGRHFISNPDLVYRLKKNIPFRDYDRSKFYNMGEADGYTTYEFCDEYKAELGMA